MQRESLFTASTDSLPDISSLDMQSSSESESSDPNPDQHAGDDYFDHPAPCTYATNERIEHAQFFLTHPTHMAYLSTREDGGDLASTRAKLMLLCDPKFDPATCTFFPSPSASKNAK